MAGAHGKSGGEFSNVVNRQVSPVFQKTAVLERLTPSILPRSADFSSLFTMQYCSDSMAVDGLIFTRMLT